MTSVCLDTSRFRIAIGCMRLTTDTTVQTALDAGFRLFDTARAYDEQLIARVLQTKAGADARIITKCGMRREGSAWIPDGRGKAIHEDARASLATLGRIDLLLLHAPDPRVPLATTARALAKILDEGIARSVGVSNVSRKQLEEIAAYVPVAAVEVALGAYDDLPIRNGVVAYCMERGIPILAHAPLGGPERAQRLLRDADLLPIAAQYGVSNADVFLAYLLAVRSEIIPVVGVRRPETVSRIATAAELQLREEDLARLDTRFPSLGALRRPPSTAALRDIEIVMMMGIAGAGKSSAAEEYVARGYERLNRDTEGGTLRQIARRLDERLDAGGARFVLDNTYVTRAMRNDVIRVAKRHGARVHCIVFETSLQDAQVNVVLRMLGRFGRVLTPEEIESLNRTDPTALPPNALSRMTRDFESPTIDEGFSEITSVPFVRRHREGKPGAMAALAEGNLQRLVNSTPESAPCLLFGWRPEGEDHFVATLRADAEKISQSTGRTIEIAYCPHPGGPPICWCRPPLPGLILSFAHRHGIDLRASTLYASSPADRTMARNLGMKL